MWCMCHVLFLLAIYLVTCSVHVQSGHCCRDAFPFLCGYIPCTSYHSADIIISNMKEQPHLHRPIYVKPCLRSVIQCGVCLLSDLSSTKFLDQNFVCVCWLYKTCYVSRSYGSWLVNHVNSIWLTVQIINKHIQKGISRLKNIEYVHSLPTISVFCLM